MQETFYFKLITCKRHNKNVKMYGINQTVITPIYLEEESKESVMLEFLKNKKRIFRTSLVVQWLRTCLPIQESRVRSLVQEDSTCHWQLSWKVETLEDTAP